MITLWLTDIQELPTGAVPGFQKGEGGFGLGNWLDESRSQAAQGACEFGGCFHYSGGLERGVRSTEGLIVILP